MKYILLSARALHKNDQKETSLKYIKHMMSNASMMSSAQVGIYISRPLDLHRSGVGTDGFVIRKKSEAKAFPIF